MKRSFSNTKESLKAPFISEESLINVVGREGYEALKVLHQCKGKVLDYDIRAEQIVYQAANLDPQKWEISGFIYTLFEILSHEMGHYMIRDMRVLEVLLFKFYL